MTAQPDTSSTEDAAQRIEAATCMVHRMFGKRPWEYILKALRNRFEITDQAQIIAIHMTVVRRLKLSDPEYIDPDARRNAQREQLLRLLGRIETDPRFKGGQMPDMAAAAQYKAILSVYDKLAKLDALYLSDHVKTQGLAMAIAGKLTDEQLDEMIAKEVANQLDTLPVERLEAAIERRRSA